MKGEELLDKYPKTGELVTNWYLQRFLDSMNAENLPEDFKKYAMEAGLSKDRVGPLIDTNPRVLFDFFDKKKIYIETIVDVDGGFWWKIGDKKSSVGYEYRTNCDSAAIEESFKQLEEICQTSS